MLNQFCVDKTGLAVVLMEGKVGQIFEATKTEGATTHSNEG